MMMIVTYGDINDNSGGGCGCDDDSDRWWVVVMI